MNDKGFNPLTASRDATSNVPRGVPSSGQDEWVALGKTLSRDFQDWLRNQSVGWPADQDLRQEILGQISLLEAEIQPLLQINRELVELEQLLNTGFSTTNFEEGGEQSASARENQPSSGSTALSSEELAPHQDGINPISEPKLKKEVESSPSSFHPQPESQLQIKGLKNLAQRLEFEQQQQKSSDNPTDSAKTPAEIASPTQRLPEIPNSPSNQQRGETTNIALPLSREEIINQYQSTPHRELSPPINKEEENPPARNYSPTSKVSPTYASSSILSDNPTDSAKTPAEIASPTQRLPEIPNSPSNQQRGETTNIALPLSREEIINQYQSTPHRELSPPINKEEENPPARNYSPTSKVSPTYASSSILSDNPTDSAKTPAEIASPTQRLPEIPNSPSNQQRGETTNIALPLSREEIINQYQSTPHRELSPPINKEEENPPARNYSPTSKVSPTYASSSILSDNPTDSAKTPAEIASPTQRLPEIPNSPSNQQRGETTNIALPLSREEIINQYQSTPHRELSPPINKEEENPPARNYSPTSKVSPTYASSSILSDNPTDSAKTPAEIASPTQRLPEIPNSPSNQQRGETTNIASPLSREEIINQYQSTPHRELSPPINKEEENPPARNYSPTSKVSPTYASSSLLLANSLPVETVSPQEKEKKSDFDIGVISEELPQILVRESLPSSLTVEPINDSPTGNSINKSKSSDLSTNQENNFSDHQWTVSNLDQENRRERKNPLTRVSQQNPRIFPLKNTAKFPHRYPRSKSPSSNFETTEQPEGLTKIEEKSQTISESILQQSHLSEAEIDLIIEAITKEIQQQYRQFYGG
ncbi:hypothetical protein H0901_10995 [Microcystis aeruginosa BLCCF158]|uniref:Uncharacterized protein n=1 Tax=Microcystis aeruginosa BLCC-F158 TaxID=2755316 RepID=A0A841UZ28_MICAE|nr:hypothetical protein [Microcystis aeruginosa]MBC1195772.1 hypothetical protein [Microcystis aeruginosa BLCC-F158]